jgi:hypothetical protein
MVALIRVEPGNRNLNYLLINVKYENSSYKGLKRLCLSHTSGEDVAFVCHVCSFPFRGAEFDFSRNKKYRSIVVSVLVMWRYRSTSS